MKDIVAVILAGGVGKRWWPLTTYKPLFRFFGKPVLAVTLNGLKKAGIKEAIVVSSPENYHEMQLVRVEGVKTSVVVQKEPRGMAEGVLAARELVKGRPCFIVNAADLVDEYHFEVLQKALAAGKPFISAVKTEEYFDGGYLKFKGERVIEIREKPGLGHEPSDYVDLVFNFFPDSEKFFRHLQETSSQKDDVFELALTKILTEQEFSVVKYEGFWVPMKSPWHVLDYLDHLLEVLPDYRGKNVVMGKNVFLEGPVWIEDGVRILENTKIVGPCYLGKNSIVGNGNLIRESHIGKGCVTGFHTDITRSYVGDDCWFHSNYVGDSILEGNISMGSGAVLANLRLDEKEIVPHRNKLGAVIASGVRIGVNASIMPGTKIGKNCFVGAGVILDRDLPQDSFCVATAGYEVKKNTNSLMLTRTRP